MPWCAHSRKARLSRVYAVKSVDPFYLGQVPAKFGPGFILMGGGNKSLNFAILKVIILCVEF